MIILIQFPFHQASRGLNKFAYIAQVKETADYSKNWLAVLADKKINDVHFY